MKSAIEVHNLSKCFIFPHHKPRRLLREELERMARRPLRWIGLDSRVTFKEERDEKFWALKNINFSVKKGETIGIIGPNGAGKSTLLKILAGLVLPTTGQVLISGKVGSLLDTSTGLHPELSGRENIYLAGAILGLSREKIKESFDEIVDFSGIEKFLDIPVKYYSSGMQVRLGFSVAIQIDPEILLIDEVLAVGDEQFRQKSLAKIENMVEEGRTILFVSHNLGVIKKLCQRVILLEEGKIKKSGKTDEIVNYYHKKVTTAVVRRDPHWYRKAVGGLWEMMGKLQFEFMVNEGLKPSHFFLDVGCGSLRGGVHFINYLKKGHYYGVDKNYELLIAGRKELKSLGIEDKNPILVEMESFQFSELKRKFHYALAQSVFTHLSLNRIARCLANIEKVLLKGGRFYATFFEDKSRKFSLNPIVHPAKIGSKIITYSDRDPYHYHFSTFEWLCENTGLRVKYLGDWGHPKDQKMMVFIKD